MTQLLAIEIRTLEPVELENPEEFPTIVVFEDENQNYFLSSGLEEIETAILELIPHLEQKAFSRLVFAVEIIPGNREDAAS